MSDKKLVSRSAINLVPGDVIHNYGLMPPLTVKGYSVVDQSDLENQIGEIPVINIDVEYKPEYATVNHIISYQVVCQADRVFDVESVLSAEAERVAKESADLAKRLADWELNSTFANCQSYAQSCAKRMPYDCYQADQKVEIPDEVIKTGTINLRGYPMTMSVGVNSSSAEIETHNKKRLIADDLNDEATPAAPDYVDASDILSECRALIIQRGRDNGYDDGNERSAKQIATVFNALKGTNLTDLDVWDLILVLKLVRAQRSSGIDSRRDLVSYAALGAECSENKDAE